MEKVTASVWPKVPPPLSDEQKIAREKYMKLWHELLPKRYGAIEKFNHGYPASLFVKPGSRTLEIGAGLGSHLEYEDLSRQEYHCLEYREEFCAELKRRYPTAQVHCADIQSRQMWNDKFFDRIVAIHVLEHLRDLPKALFEIERLLKDDGVFDVVIPCEGGLAHTTARKISAERLFKKNFHMDFTPIHKNEHVSTYFEIVDLLKERFQFERRSFFPLKLALPNLNFCAGFRLKKRQ